MEFLFPDVPFFNEFCIKIPDLKGFYAFCAEKGIYPGVKLERFFSEYRDALLVCVTETKTKKDLELFAETVRKYSDEKR